jgi:hypothetical protein
MQVDQALRRLTAWHAGKPLPLYQTLHFPVAAPNDNLILAFVRMGGESAPWGVAVGHPGAKPTVLTVPEARNRDLVASMVAELAPILLRHFRHPEFSNDQVSGLDRDLPLRQLWLPNPSHTEMLHAIAYSYTFTKWGSPERAHRLNAIGRLGGWLFREAQRAGQVTVMAATDALQTAYTFPADPVRQAHLGYLLAWLETRGGRDRRLRAAQEAEVHSISTSLDPLLERDTLDKLVERWGDASKAGDTRKATRDAAAIERTLKDELLHRYRLVEAALDVITSDKRRVNIGVSKLTGESMAEWWYQYLRLELRLEDEVDGPVFVPSPETDRSPAAAAARYYVYSASDEFRLSALIHDDDELQEEVIAAGDGLRGKIVEVRDEGEGRKTRPVWTIEAPEEAPLRIREGTDLCVGGLPSRQVCVRTIDRKSAGMLRVEVEVRSLLTVPRDNDGSVLPAADPRHRGREIVLLPTSKDRISRLKVKHVWETDRPGAWLTHARPAGARAALPDDVRDEREPLVSE